MYLRKGTRVKLSAFAIKRKIRRNKENILGTIATDRQFLKKSYAVIWDGNKSVDRLHERFVEEVTP